MVVLWGFFFGYDINPKNPTRNEGWSHCTRSCQKVKFISTIYILKELPILSPLSRIFQADTNNYARIEPNIKYTMDAMNQSKSPIVKVKKDLQEGGRLCTLGLHTTEHLMTEIQSHLEKSVNALMSNIYDSLDVTIPILFSFNHCANVERRNFSILWNVGSQSSWSLFWIWERLGIGTRSRMGSV